MATCKLAIDAMSGDHGLNTTIPAVASALLNDKDLHITIVGQQSVIESYLQQHNITLPDNHTFHNCTEIVQMDDAPAQALRNKKDSSLRVSLNLLKDKQVDAVVSAGNTGALMATARYVLKMLPGIQRPAIIAAFPSITGRVTHMLDLGANVDCSAEQLLQFALMGSVYCKSITGVRSPTTCLLNIGSEEIKGCAEVKLASELIKQQKNINYQGYIEADSLFQGEVDLVVCDGFVGNSVLKTAEGTIKMLFHLLRSEFNEHLTNKMRGLLAKPVLKNVYQYISPEVYNGSPLLGLQANVIKSHGGTSSKGFFHAIEKAQLIVEQQLAQKISLGLKALQVQPEA